MRHAHCRARIGALLLLALAGAAGAGCYAPELTSGRIHCGPQQLCPAGFSCGPDGLCHEPGGSSVGSDAGSGADSADLAPADAEAPDAPAPDRLTVDPDSGDTSADGVAPPACVDTLSDPAHCGACGHACLGAPCVEGHCTPELLARDASSPSAIAVLTDQVFWVQGNDEVLRLTLSAGAGAAPVRIADHDGGDPVAIVADPASSEVYWSEAGSRSLWRHLPPYAPEAEVRLASEPDGRPADLVIDATHVYFGNPEAEGLFRLPRSAAAGSAEALVTGVRPTALAARPGTVYWVDRSAGTVNATDSATRATRQLATGEQGPLALGVDGTHVYWLVCGEKDDCSKGQLRRLPVAGGLGPEVLAAEQKLGPESGPGAIALGEAHVYWVAFGQGRLLRLPTQAVGGGEAAAAPLVLVSEPAGPRALALDATHVYWVNQKAHTVQRVAR